MVRVLLYCVICGEASSGQQKCGPFFESYIFNTIFVSSQMYPGTPKESK